MNRTSKRMLAMFLYVGCAITALPVLGQKPTPALVVNSTAQPVPTLSQGTTNVDGTVNIGNVPNVTVANTPNVNIANTPSVGIVGTPTVTLAPGASTSVTNPQTLTGYAIPLATTEGAFFYIDQCQGQFSGNSSATCYFRPVPPGKTLVVQEFDASMAVNTGLKLLTVVLNDGETNHYFMDVLMGTDGLGFDDFATHQATHLYVITGITPRCGVLANTGSGTGGYINCQLSGYLVDQP